jgi:colanic acid/amylovoran biosynthesis glycosyltransferase
MNRDKNGKLVVAHVMRGYLAPTETFIGNQIVSLKEFSPIVLTHHRKDGHSYPIKEIVCVKDLLPRPWGILDKTMYGMFRSATAKAVDMLANYALERNAKLLHFHYLVDGRFFLPLKRKTGLPGIVSGYGYDVSLFPKLYAGCGKYYLRPLFDVMDWFLAMSQDMKRDLVDLGCPEGKIIVHYFGTDTRRFAYPERKYRDGEKVTILACGTLEIKKAQHLILQALRLMEEQKMINRRFRVEFVGDGPMLPLLQRQVAEYGWMDRVTFCGRIPHHEDRLIKAYQEADIFSLPSITVKSDKEGIPGTIVEAMASGLPVVSSYHAGIPEIIESGKEGILVREGDIEAMAQAFAGLINDVSLRKELGQAAAKRATTELDLHQGTARLEAIYRRILGE